MAARSAAALDVANRNRPDRAAAPRTHRVADRNERRGAGGTVDDAARHAGAPGAREIAQIWRLPSGYSRVDLVASSWRFIYRGSAERKVHALMLKLTSSLRLSLRILAV